MDLAPKIAIGATILAVLLFGTRSRAQSRNRAVTRGLVVGNSIMAHGGAVNVLKQQTRAPWDNVAVVGQNTAAVLRQAQAALRQPGYYSHVVVEGGVNDGDRPASFTTTNLTQIYLLARSAGAQVIAVTETPFRGYAGWNEAAQRRQTAAVRWLTTYEGIRYADRVVDAYTQFSARGRPGYLDERYAAPDGLHLNSDGQRLLGALILQAIRR